MILRIRQHQMDEADVAEVVGHLVDEEGLAAAVDARVFEILLAERAQLSGVQLAQHGGIARLAFV